MSSAASLDALPIELIYCLFDYLDLPTIFISLRCVCRRLHSIVNAYNQYRLDMRLLSKADFDRICRVVSPAQVQSLVLTDDMNTPHQIRTFFSHFALDRFVRLQSLQLTKIEESSLFALLLQIPYDSLKSLSIECFPWDTFTYTIRILLCSVIANSKLERLCLNSSYRDLDLISWSPLPKTLKYLCLEHCTFQEYCMILRHATNLQDLTLTKCVMQHADGSIYQPSDQTYPARFHSFKLGACFMRLKELFLLLSRAPTLQHLKLIVWTDMLGSVIDGKQWEAFIPEHLPLLNKFEFFFDDITQISIRTMDIRSYVAPFRTPFWLEQHQWHVACDYIKTLCGIRLYSLPTCNPVFMFYTDSMKLTTSTLPTVNERLEVMQQVHRLSLNLNETIDDVAEIPSDEAVGALFRRVQCLSLNFDGRQEHASLPFLRTIVDLSSVVRLTLQLLVHNFAQPTALNDYLSSILKSTVHIHTLKLTYIHTEDSPLNMQSLCALVPPSVRHLQISVLNFAEMRTILEQLPHLFNITFYSSKIALCYDDIEKWIQLRRPSSLSRRELGSIQIWLGSVSRPDVDKSLAKRVLGRFMRRRVS